MKLYESYLKESKEGALEDLVLVKEGFCYPAFFFSFVWFLYKGMFKWSLIVLMLNILVSALFESYSNAVLHSLLTSLSISLAVGLNANNIYSGHLKKTGYKLKGYVFGKDKGEAEFRFVNDILPQDPKNVDIYLKPLIEGKKNQKNKELISKYFNRDFKDYFAIRKL